MSTPEDTPNPEKKPEAEAKPAEAENAAPALEKSNQEDSADRPSVAKPKFKVTRSPFAPKTDGGEKGSAPKPGPVTLPKQQATAAKPAEAKAPKPPEASAEAPAKPSAPAKKAAAPNPMADAVSASPKPASGAPKPVAPVSARKAAEMAEEEDAKFSPALLAVDAIAAIVAIAFGILIILGTKG